MNDENEKAINSIQKDIDYFVFKKLSVMVDAFERKAELYNINDLEKLVQEEHIKVIDILESIYSRNTEVESIKDYFKQSNYLWDCDFIEVSAPEVVHKWYRNHCFVSYSDFCKDNTILDEELPFFSAIYQAVLHEKYAQYLEERGNRKWPSYYIVMEKDEDSISPKSESISKPAIEDNPVKKPTFEHSLNDLQIECLVDLVNKVQMFTDDNLTFEQLKSIFDCQPITTLTSNNNHLLTFFFYELANRGYIVGNWQSVIAKNNLFNGPKKKSPLNQQDISSAVDYVKNIDVNKNSYLVRIQECIKKLKIYGSCEERQTYRGTVGN